MINSIATHIRNNENASEFVQPHIDVYSRESPSHTMHDGGKSKVGAKAYKNVMALY